MDIRQPQQQPVIEVSDHEIRIDFALDAKCRTTITLKSLSSTNPVAFKVQTSSPHKFLVNPPAGVIPTSSSVPIQFILKPQRQLPESFPRSPSDRFLIRATPLEPRDSIDSVESWLSHQAVYYVKLKVAFGGPVLLRHAVECGDVVKVRSLMKRDKNLLANIGEDEARELLRIVARLRGDIEREMVTVLSDAGLKETSRDSQPLDCRADPRGEEIFTAARRGDVKLLKSLLHDRGRMAPTFRDRNGLTALHAAAIKGYEEVVHLLLEAGIPIDTQDNEGHTPLHLATLHGDPGTVGALIDRRADVNARSKGGVSPLDIATTMGIDEITEILIKRGAVPVPQFASCSKSTDPHPPNQNKA